MGDEDNGPPHPVTITKPFWLGQYEVTQAEWMSVMTENAGHDEFVDPQAPVDSVSWEDCQAFIAKLNALEKLPPGWTYALPTEAQWEYACRAGAKGTTTWMMRSSATWDGVIKTAETGRKESAANVPTPGASTTCTGMFMNGARIGMATTIDERRGHAGSTGPPSGSDRVGRGGSFYDPASGCRSAYRNRGTPSFRNYGLGFRVAVVPSPLHPEEKAKEVND